MTTLADLERVERELRDIDYTRQHADTIAAYIAAQGWRTIETAPNDVSILVAYDDESIELVEAEDNNFKWSGRNPVTQSILGIVNPTHWMPLPEPPKENATKGSPNPEGLSNG